MHDQQPRRLTIPHETFQSGETRLIEPRECQTRRHDDLPQSRHRNSHLHKVAGLRDAEMAAAACDGGQELPQRQGAVSQLEHIRQFDDHAPACRL
jgi:hypothetical protein